MTPPPSAPHAPPITHYVLGFAFDDAGRVVLIRKNQPAWQRDLLNGIGGKIEHDEQPVHAMVREFAEETGVITLPEEWRLVTVMDGPDWRMHVYTMRRDTVTMDVATVTTEAIQIAFPARLPENVVPSIRYLLWMAQDTNLIAPRLGCYQ